MKWQYNFWNLLFIGSITPLTGGAQSMQYISSETKMIIDPGNKKPAALRLQIDTRGRGCPLIFTKILLNNKNNIPVKVFYTGKQSSFTETQVFGVGSSAGIPGEQELLEGENYFWLVTTGNEKKNRHPFPVQVHSFDLGVQQYRQVWADEFNADTINAGNWNYEEGFIRNEEDQWYQKENATCSHGILTIEAK